jgi:hypothetical protein
MILSAGGGLEAGEAAGLGGGEGEAEGAEGQLVHAAEA